MIISLDFLDSFIKSKIINVVKIPRGNYAYEYSMENYNEGRVFGLIELEHNIISDLDNKIIGYFGVNYEHNIFVYYLKI